MRPFKLKPELVGHPDKIIALAEEVFGFAHTRIMGGDFWTASWSGGRGYDFNTLTISCNTFDDHIVAQVDFEIVPWEGMHPDSFWWAKAWSSFLEKSSKTWDLWSEDEIISSPMWCRYFVEETGKTTDRIHTAMVMRSYENPEDSHVKEYFRSWKSRQSI